MHVKNNGFALSRVHSIIGILCFLKGPSVVQWKNQARPWIGSQCKFANSFYL